MTMKRLWTLAAMPLLALTLSACALLETNDPLPTITDIVVETDAVSTLEAAVVQEGLDGALADKGAQYTVFAPTNDAFGAFLAANDIEASDLLALADLTDILLYHVIDGKLTASDVIGSAPGTVETLQGNDLSYAVVDGGVVLTDATGRDVNVIDTDINAFNGVIHLIDDVLLPFGTITDIAVATDATATLEAAVIAAELDGALADLTATYTVFAPTEDAFAAALSALDVTAEFLLDPENVGLLTDILTYHVIPNAELFAADVIAAVDAGGGTAVVTTLQGETIAVTVSDGTVQLTDAKGTTMNVIGTDINALNGVIHLIDFVLRPSTGPDVP